MSHTTAINSIAIRSIVALRAAVDYLKSKGIACSLVPDETPRAYYPNQPGLGKADFVLKLNDAKYDVGFYKDDKGGYEVRTDFWAGNVAAVLGVPAPAKSTNQQHLLGKLFQAYGMTAAEEQARKQGYMVARQHLPDGRVKLQLTGFR